MATPFRVVRRDTVTELNEYVEVEGTGAIGSLSYMVANGSRVLLAQQGQRDRQGATGATGTVSTKDLTAVVGGQFIHKISDLKIGQAGGGAGFLNTTTISVDGLVQCRVRVDNANVLHTASTGARDALYLHQADLHYTSSSRGTTNRVTPFS